MLISAFKNLYTWSWIDVGLYNCLPYFAFAYNAESFAIDFLFLRVTQKALQLPVFFSFFVGVSETGWLFFLPIFYHLSPRIGCDQDRTYYEMPCMFRSCPLETNNNGRFKLEHVESCSSTTKTYLHQCLWPPNLAGWLTMMGTHPPIKSHDSLITWSYDITWTTKNTSTIRVPMATKLGRMVTYLDGLLPIKSCTMGTKLDRVLTYRFYLLRQMTL